MPFSTFAELKTVIADRLHDDGLDDEIEDAISLCEAEMQRDLKLVEFEATGSITVTSGSGDLPADFVGMRAVYWDGNTSKALEYVAPAKFDSLRNISGGQPAFYTISGSTIRVNQGADGTAVATYLAKFTALSDSNTSNSLLASHPDSYLYGTLKHMAVHTRDTELLQLAGTMFNAAKGGIKTNNQDRKYAGPLQVRAR